MIYDYLKIEGKRTSPWVTDKEFNLLFEKIKKKYTLVDIYRCYELWDLVKHVSKLSEGCFLEIGVWNGGTGTLIAKRAKQLGVKENIYLCDTFKGVVKTNSEYDDAYYKDGKHSNCCIENVKQILKYFNIEDVKILVGIFPEETKHLFLDKKIRFCHIDVDIYQSAKDILNYIWPMIIPGGIVVYDDYGFEKCCGIEKHIQEISSDKDKIIIYNLNGHVIIYKI
jgi:hypothetical protein